MACKLNAWFCEISIPTPRKVIGNPEGEGIKKPKNEVKLDFPEGREGSNQTSSMGVGGMVIL